MVTVTEVCRKSREGDKFMEVRSKGQRYGAKVRDAMKELDE